LAAEQLELENIFNELWVYLREGSERSKSDFHLSALCTISDNKPRLRTVVLRRVIEKQYTVMIHTDRRSAKYEEISSNPAVSLLLYSKDKKVQIRLEGTASLHTDDILAEEQWKSSKLQSRKCYLSELSPGTKVNKSHTGASEIFGGISPSEEESEHGQKNFCVISVKINKIDWLFLRSRGHLRCNFIITEDGIEKYWLVP
jgi:pyridoxine/pyridoxamine 5'-phosphate oxidase